MVISLRLTGDLEKKLKQAAARAGLTKSAFLRKCLENELTSDQSRPSAYELGKDLFGKYSSGRSDLSENAEQIVREKIHAKARRNRYRSTGGSV